MIPIQRLSASSIEDLDKCELSFFIKYVLNRPDPSGDKAEKGTVCHNVMEAVAISKQLMEKGQKTTKNEIFGTLRQTYDIRKLFKKAFEYSKNTNPHLKWGDADRDETWDFLSTSFGHKFFPDNHKEIIQPEQYFRIEIPYDWARYSYLDDGELKESRLLVSGKIDIMFRDHDNSLNYLDYKFGAKPMNWNRFKEYSYEDMYKNIQLCLYYWAVRQLHPEEHPITHIWYPRANKLWTYHFDEEQINTAMKRVKACFEKLKFAAKPSPNYGQARCNMCYFRKASMTDIGLSQLSMEANGSEHFKLAKDESPCVCDTMVKFFSARSVGQVISACKKERE